eukprot:gene13506-biopygen2291
MRYCSRRSYVSGCSADARRSLPSEQGSADTILTSERSVEAKESGNLEDLVRSDSYAKTVEAEDSGNLEVLVRSDSYAEAERDADIRPTSEDGSADGGRDEGGVGCPQSTPPAAVSLLKQEPRDPTSGAPGAPGAPKGVSTPPPQTCAPGAPGAPPGAPGAPGAQPRVVGGSPTCTPSQCTRRSRRTRERVPAIAFERCRRLSRLSRLTRVARRAPHPPLPSPTHGHSLTHLNHLSQQL